MSNEYPSRYICKRVLTNEEFNLRKDKRCIICGAKVTINIVKEDGIKVERWFPECVDCIKYKYPHYDHEIEYGKSFGVDIHTPYKRILGYVPKDIV